MAAAAAADVEEEDEEEDEGECDPAVEEEPGGESVEYSETCGRTRTRDGENEKRRRKAGARSE